jgi:basic membrane protein A
MTCTHRSMHFLRVVAFVATLALLLPAAALAKAPPKITVGLAYQTGATVWDAMARLGALQAQADFGVKLAEARGAHKNPTTVLKGLATRSDLVVAVGFTYEQAADLAADKHPGTNFAVLDSVFETTPQDNLMYTTFAANEGSFLVGAAAALKSTTGGIGFIGGVRGAWVLDEFEAGFAAGVAYQDAGASLTVEYLTDAPDYSGFSTPALAYAAAMTMYANGIDVIYHAAGNSGIGLFEAARDYSVANTTHVWAIGVDYDQYLDAPADLQPYILTSMIKRVDVATYDVIASQVDGSFAGGNQRWDLSRNGVDYATSGGFVDDILPALEDIRDGIIGGLISVPTVP